LASVTSKWGMAGIVALRERVSVIVIVDVLSFSTAVDVAVSRGCVVYPFPYGEPASGSLTLCSISSLCYKNARFVTSGLDGQEQFVAEQVERARQQLAAS